MNIMVCFDNSDAANRALMVARDHVKAFGGVLHICAHSRQTTDIREKDVNKMANTDRELAKIQKDLTDEGFSCVTQLLVSDQSPGAHLIEYADQNQMNEIFVGIKKTSKVDKLVFGSTAQHIILNATCAVVTVKSDIPTHY